MEHKPGNGGRKSIAGVATSLLLACASSGQELAGVPRVPAEPPSATAASSISIRRHLSGSDGAREFRRATPNAAHPSRSSLGEEQAGRPLGEVLASSAGLAWFDLRGGRGRCQGLDLRVHAPNNFRSLTNLWRAGTRGVTAKCGEVQLCRPCVRDRFVPVCSGLRLGFERRGVPGRVFGQWCPGRCDRWQCRERRERELHRRERCERRCSRPRRERCEQRYELCWRGSIR